MKTYIINQINRLNYLTFKDIQEENKEITRLFQKKALDYIDDNEKKENESIAIFLIKIAHISRSAYNNSNKLFINMLEEFSKYKIKEKKIYSLEYDEQFRKEFSSWVKEYEKELECKQKYENFFNSFKSNCKNSKQEEYIHALFSQLIILYFHCKLSFPIVEIDFNSELEFNHEKMIDFINKGNNRKVNFVILPSLFANNNYLENGKSWVFTYKKDTFKFGKINFEDLVDKIEKLIIIFPNNK